MPSPGLSLFGFLTEQEATQYVADRFVLEGPTDPAQLWREARERIGGPMPRAGAPEILDLPPGHERYLEAIQSAWWFPPNTEKFPWAFKLVEIAPLLSFQMNVSLDRSKALCSRLNDNPTFEDLLAFAMPDKLEELPTEMSTQSNSIVITSPSRNLRLRNVVKLDMPGSEGSEFFGIQVGPAAPITQVARVGERCYMRNGFHRAFGLAQRGVTHVPALLIDMESYEDVIRGGLRFFSRDVMESENPPTIGHFTQMRAFPVTAWESSTVITLSWSHQVRLETQGPSADA